jgi:hypothetical protein
MINLPGQTLTDLARDLVFFREMNVDMIGCGPYIMQTSTPIGEVHPLPTPYVTHPTSRPLLSFTPFSLFLSLSSLFFLPFADLFFHSSSSDLGEVTPQCGQPIHGAIQSGVA